MKCITLTKWPILHAILSHICISQRTSIFTFEVCKNVYLCILKMYVKFQSLIPNLHGSLGLPSIGGDLLTICPIQLVIVPASTMVCNFLTRCIWNIKSTEIVTMHLWKMPLKYWGMVLSLNGLLGLQQSGIHHGPGGVSKKWRE